MQALRAVEPDKVAGDRERLFLALGYPNGQGEEHGLFVYADRKDFRRNWRAAEAPQKMKVHTASSAPATHCFVGRGTPRADWTAQMR